MLNVEIKNHFIEIKRSKVRRGIIPGNPKSLWKAINIAKDINPSEIPRKMMKDGFKSKINLSDKLKVNSN